MVTEILLQNPSLEEDQYAPLGGQAVIEGVMMKGQDAIAIAVRPIDGDEIVLEKQPFHSITRRIKILGLPFLRGAVSLFETMKIGFDALNFSATAAFGEDEEPASPLESVLSLGIGLLFAIGLFMVLPGYIFVTLQKYIDNIFIVNLIEGLVRATIFITYISLISLSKDVKRLFQYHGAEHKVIHAYEAGEALTIENAKEHTTLHPRCGTSFLVITMVISILTFSFLGQAPDLMTRVLSKLALLPIVAGVSFELIRLSGQIKDKPNNVLVKMAYFLTLPGLLLQKITTSEPDNEQLEVAIASLKKVLEENPEEVLSVI